MLKIEAAYGRANEEAVRYCRSIRTPAKGAYAHRYWEWLAYGKTSPEPGAPSGLSYMAAQAVRFKLNAIIEGR